MPTANSGSSSDFSRTWCLIQGYGSRKVHKYTLVLVYSSLLDLGLRIKTQGVFESSLYSPSHGWVCSTYSHCFFEGSIFNFLKAIVFVSFVPDLHSARVHSCFISSLNVETIAGCNRSTTNFSLLKPLFRHSTDLYKFLILSCGFQITIKYFG